MSFHEIRFPTDISRGAQGGPERRTDVVVLGSGFEERNARWADSRRSYNAGYGVKSQRGDAGRRQLSALRGAGRDHGGAGGCAGAAQPVSGHAIGTSE